MERRISGVPALFGFLFLCSLEGEALSRLFFSVRSLLVLLLAMSLHSDLEQCRARVEHNPAFYFDGPSPFAVEVVGLSLVVVSCFMLPGGRVVVVVVVVVGAAAAAGRPCLCTPGRCTEPSVRPRRAHSQPQAARDARSCKL